MQARQAGGSELYVGVVTNGDDAVGGWGRCGMNQVGYFSDGFPVSRWQRMKELLL